MCSKPQNLCYSHKIIYPNLDFALFSSKEWVKFFTFKKTQAVNDFKQKVLFEILPFFLCRYFSIPCSLAIWALLRDISLLLFHCIGRICIFKQLFVCWNILDSDLLTYSYSDPLTYSYSDPLTYSKSDLLTYSDPLTYLLFNVFNVTQ
jgi:hypothetical protein